MLANKVVRSAFWRLSHMSDQGVGRRWAVIVLLGSAPPVLAGSSFASQSRSVTPLITAGSRKCQGFAWGASARWRWRRWGTPCGSGCPFGRAWRCRSNHPGHGRSHGRQGELPPRQWPKKKRTPNTIHGGVKTPSPPPKAVAQRGSTLSPKPGKSSNQPPAGQKLGGAK